MGDYNQLDETGFIQLNVRRLKVAAAGIKGNKP